MKEIIKTIIQIIHILSFCGMLLFGALGALYEIIGHAKFEKMLSAIGISKGFERVWIFGSITLLLSIITYVIKVKVFKD